MIASLLSQCRKAALAGAVAIALAGSGAAKAQQTFVDTCDTAGIATFFNDASSGLYIDTGNYNGSDAGVYNPYNYVQGVSTPVSAAYDASQSNIFNAAAAKFSKITVRVYSYGQEANSVNNGITLSYSDSSTDIYSAAYTATSAELTLHGSTANGWQIRDYTARFPASRYVKFTLIEDTNNQYASSMVSVVTLTKANAGTAAAPVFTDEFSDASQIAPPLGTGGVWHFEVPGYSDQYPFYNTNKSYYAPDIAVTGGSLNITMPYGSLTSKNLRNVVSLTPKSVPADWYVECRFSANWAANDPFYPSGGFGVFTDINNYTLFELKKNPAGSAYPVVVYAKNGTYQDDAVANFTDTGAGSGGKVTLRIAKDSATGSIFLGFQTPSDSNFREVATLTSSESDTNRANVYTMLNNIGSSRVGFFQQNPGNGNIVYAYDHFSTSLVPNTDFIDNFDNANNFPAPLGTGSVWHFDVPSQGDTSNAAYITLANGTLNPTDPYGNLENGNAFNVANLKVTSAPANWYIETSMGADWTDATDFYPSSGIGVITDNANYALLQIKKSSYQLPNSYEYMELVYAKNGTYHDDAVSLFTSSIGTVGGGMATLRLEKDPLTNNIIAYVIRSGVTNYENFFTLTPTETDPARADVYSLLNKLPASRVGIFQHNNGSPEVTYHYDYFTTNATVVPPGVTLTGTIALDGVTDLSAVNPLVPVGNITFDFFAANSAAHTVPMFSLTAPISTTGAFSLSGVTPGIYDIGISSSKSLRTVVKSINANSNAAIPGVTTLLGGNTNGDKTVNFDDFLVLLNAFGSKVSDPNSGFDPTADFTYDGIVNFDDFLVLLNNFGVVSDP